MGLVRLFLSQEVSLERFGHLFELQIQSFAGRPLDLSILHLSFELLILDAPITGDLVNASGSDDSTGAAPPLRIRMRSCRPEREISMAKTL